MKRRKNERNSSKRFGANKEMRDKKCLNKEIIIDAEQKVKLLEIHASKFFHVCFTDKLLG